MTARDSLSQVRFSAFGQQFAAEASRPQRRRKICQTLFIGFAPWFAFLTGAAERAKRQSKFNVMPLIYGKPSSRQAVKPHFLCFFLIFFFDPAVIFSLAAGRSLYLIYRRLDVCALPYSVFSLTKTAVKRWKIAENHGKTKKNQKKSHFFHFFCWFYFEIHKNGVY